MAVIQTRILIALIIDRELFSDRGTTSRAFIQPLLAPSYYLYGGGRLKGSHTDLGARWKWPGWLFLTQ